MVVLFARWEIGEELSCAALKGTALIGTKSFLISIFDVSRCDVLI